MGAKTAILALAAHKEGRAENRPGLVILPLRLLLRQFIRRDVLHVQVAVNHAIGLRVLRLIPEDGGLDIAEFYAAARVLPFACLLTC